MNNKLSVIRLLIQCRLCFTQFQWMYAGPKASILSALVPTLWSCASRIFSYSVNTPGCPVLTQNFALLFWSCPVCFLVCVTSSRHFVVLFSFFPCILPHLSSRVLMSHLSCPSLSTFFPLVSYCPWEIVTLTRVAREVGFRKLTLDQLWSAFSH